MGLVRKHWVVKKETANVWLQRYLFDISLPENFLYVYDISKRGHAAYGTNYAERYFRH